MVLGNVYRMSLLNGDGGNAKKGAAIFGVTVAFLMSAYSVFSLVYIMQELSARFHVTLGIVSVAATLSFFGGALGGAILGRFADISGRKPALLLSAVIFSAATVLASQARSIDELYACWLMVGFGANAENGISYAVIVELLKGSRGIVGGAIQGLYFIGMMLDVLTLLFIGYWRTYMLAVGAISLVVSVAGILMIPETVNVKSEKHELREIFRGKLLPVTALGTLIVAAAFMYTIPVATLIPSVLRSGNLLVLDAVGFISFTVAGYVSDKIRRMKSIMAFAAVGILSSIIAIIFGIGIGQAVLLYVGTGYFAFVGIMMSELYPIRLRGTGSNFAFLTGRIMGGLGPSIVAIAFAGELQAGIGTFALGSSCLALASAILLMKYSA
ncbi:MAG: MFS transporter [Nitrososphaerota archaeon]|jgi:MFS family permease|nr:MFS transporter [Nitrososphaerota archaeon]MDG6930628.1 MFS transporter [Nitrososphaerota archaeon]MDG6932747.1 MFS transporter [Nitrososphaerota archaeon]MDG6935864.1 MFS transporter [Nitrososphaerota archaeon]MDG6944185.1 MFS transporter [Nitrososphaerota archaeon]